MVPSPLAPPIVRTAPGRASFAGNRVPPPAQTLDSDLVWQDACACREDAGGGILHSASPEHAAMNIEIVVPEEWTPGQALAMRQLLQHAVRTGQPVISFVRKDVTPDQLKDIYERIEALIREAGLQVAET